MMSRTGTDDLKNQILIYIPSVENTFCGGWCGHRQLQVGTCGPVVTQFV